MGMRKSGLASATASLALTIGVMGALTGTASASTGAAGAAATGITVCKDAYEQNCATNVPGYVGDVLKQVRPDLQDSISSIRNNSATTICFYEHNNYVGRGVAVPSGGALVNLSGTYVGGSSMNDVISSWAPLGGGGPKPPPGAAC
ncbi:peptidase inhibitor family I36 protein [Streptomyces sp. CB02400]|uniref:peptidase inhibitor family I36 protein n=1 Tax=unclassified Streptomyces TaxID=2593676 RepID=UPI000A70FE88|nr:peptidase inhibitor family I36 protein [Streptomyces sp. CB02400]